MNLTQRIESVPDARHFSSLSYENLTQRIERRGFSKNQVHANDGQESHTESDTSSCEFHIENSGYQTTSLTQFLSVFGLVKLQRFCKTIANLQLQTKLSIASEVSRSCKSLQTKHFAKCCKILQPIAKADSTTLSDKL